MWRGDKSENGVRPEVFDWGQTVAFDPEATSATWQHYGPPSRWRSSFSGMRVEFGEVPDSVLDFMDANRH
jgi:hypothetical protein